MKNQNGIGAIGVVGVLMIVALVAISSWYVISNRSSLNPGVNDSAQNSNKTPQTSNDQSYLKIKEWGVKLKKDAALKNATYKIADDDKYFKNVAYLSTAEIDSSETCKQYYSHGPMPTFQSLIRYDLDDKVSFDEGGTYISAKDAPAANNFFSKSYKRIGDYVYHYSAANGYPCSDGNATKVEESYGNAFNSIEQM